MDGGQDRLTTLFHGGDRSLKLLDEGHQFSAGLRSVGGNARLDARQDAQVHPRTEMFALSGQDDHTHVIVGVHLFKGGLETGPTGFIEGVSALWGGEEESGNVVGDGNLHGGRSSSATNYGPDC